MDLNHLGYLSSAHPIVNLTLLRNGKRNDRRNLFTIGVTSQFTVTSWIGTESWQCNLFIHLCQQTLYNSETSTLTPSIIHLPSPSLSPHPHLSNSYFSFPHISKKVNDECMSKAKHALFPHHFIPNSDSMPQKRHHLLVMKEDDRCTVPLQQTDQTTPFPQLPQFPHPRYLSSSQDITAQSATSYPPP